MAGIGPNGIVTTHPSSGEKICVGCEYWTGARDVTYNGTAATSRDKYAAFCKMKKADTLPNQPCLCTPNKFMKWSYLK